MLDPRLHQLALDDRSRPAAGRPAGLELALTDRAASRRSGASQAVTVRVASGDDDAALARLAQLDCAEPPRAPVLLAEVAGEPAVALSLADGAVVADPFTPTTELIALLRLRARQLRRADAASAAGTARPRILRRLRRVAFGARA